MSSASRLIVTTESFDFRVTAGVAGLDRVARGFFAHSSPFCIMSAQAASSISLLTMRPIGVSFKEEDVAEEVAEEEEAGEEKEAEAYATPHIHKYH